MIINHNLMAMNTYNKLTSNNAAASKSLEKLSSGLRINRAGDDAAGLAISEKMRGQIRGLDQAGSNAQNSISLIQTAEGALTETHSILQRMRELAVQAGNDTNTDSDRTQLQSEITASIAEIDRIGNTTEFNTKKLIDGSALGVAAKVAGSVLTNNNSAVTVNLASNANSLFVKAMGTSSKIDGAYMVVRVAQSLSATSIAAGDFKVIGPDGKAVTAVVTAHTTGFSFAAGTFGNIAANSLIAATVTGIKVGESVTFSFNKFQAASNSVSNSIMTQIGANTGQNMFISLGDMRAKALGVNTVDISTKFGSQTAIATIDVAINKVSTQRANIGAIQNRLEHTVNNLSSASENISAAESRIRDVDMAKEMMNYQKTSILQQAATSMLAQANQQPQNVLKLLQ